METTSYTNQLCKPCNPEEIIRLSNIVFVEGHLERLDDLIVAILPLANITYYKYIRSLDDREYAKEDLISDAILRLYQDMYLRWDKYIHIDAPYHYFSMVLKNGMINLVHEYHNHYAVNELDPETIKDGELIDNAYEEVEFRLLKSSIKKSILEVATKVLSCRRVNTNLLLNILKYKYVEKEDLNTLKSRVHVLGISNKLFNFYCGHVEYVYKLSYNYQYAVLGGKSKMIHRFSSTLDRFEDMTYKMLSMKYYDSIIPEIYAEFGPEVTKRFVRIFSDRTVQVPNYTEFCDDLFGSVVYSLSNGDKENLYKIADTYHIPYRSLSRIYNNANSYVEEKKGDR